MAASLRGVDVLALTGGIGEHDQALKAELVEALAWLPNLEIAIVPADEEGMIARGDNFPETGGLIVSDGTLVLGIIFLYCGSMEQMTQFVIRILKAFMPHLSFLHQASCAGSDRCRVFEDRVVKLDYWVSIGRM